MIDSFHISLSTFKNSCNLENTQSKFIQTIEVLSYIFKIYKIQFSLQYIFILRKYEHAIRTYEGDDPLAPHFEYMKWLEQIYLKHGPESNLMPLIEETVQKFKNDAKYKQDPRFITILINFVSNQLIL